jgi:hypothetical protein
VLIKNCMCIFSIWGANLQCLAVKDGPHNITAILALLLPDDGGLGWRGG